MKKITKLILLLCCSLMAVHVHAKLSSEDFGTSVDAFSNDDGNISDWAVATGSFNDGVQSVHNAYANNNNILSRSDVFGRTAISNAQLSVFADDYCEFVRTNSSYYTKDFTASSAETNISSTSSDHSLGETIDFSVIPFGAATLGVSVWVDWNNDIDESFKQK